MKKKIIFLGLLTYGFVNHVSAQFTTNSGDIKQVTPGKVAISDQTPAPTPVTQLHILTNGAAAPLRLERVVSGNQNNSLDFGFTSNPVTGVTLAPGSLMMRLNGASSDMTFLLNPTTIGFTQKVNGNFGISTAAPTAKLDAFSAGTGNSAKNIAATSLNGTSPRSLFMVSSLGSGGYNDISAAQDFGIFWNDNTNTFNSTAGLVIAPHKNAQTGIRIAANGYVGIGTPAPNALLHVRGKAIIGDLTQTAASANADYKLAVDGKIVSKNMVVSIDNWADYVFKKEYSLMSLTELKNFIEQNSHLPEIPSACDIETSGVNLGEMVKLQMQKIEELTLYILNQQKQIDELKLMNKK